MNFKLFAVLAACCMVFQSANAQERMDRRIQPSLSGTVSPWNDAEISQLIKNSKDKKLIKAIEGGLPMQLCWNQRISLSDADYALCMFDSTIRMSPGSYPRVLVLFDLNGSVKIYGLFTAQPDFGYGAIVQGRENTFFIIVSHRWQYGEGGKFDFEKYLITPTAIIKLGEGYELTKIPDSPPAADGGAAKE